MQKLVKTANNFFSKFILVGFIVLSLIWAQNASALGQVATPIVIDDAVSGQTYESQLTLIGNSNKKQFYTLNATGDIANWVKFYSIDNPNDPINTIKIEANSRVNAIIKFEIPGEMPVGIYKGKATLAFASANENENKGGVAVTQQISREVIITITNQKDAASFVVIRADHNEISQGDAINFDIQCNNTGNVIIKPIVEIEIFKNNVRVDDIIFPYNKDKKGIIPRQTETLVASWQSGKREVGEYVAAARVYLDDVVAQETRFPFEIKKKNNILATANLSNVAVINFLKNLFIPIIFFVAAILFVVIRKFNKRDEQVDKSIIK